MLFHLAIMMIARILIGLFRLQAAYRENTLGLPKICPEGNIQKIDRKTLFTYLKNHYCPRRMVVAGVGVDHKELVSAVEK